MKAIVAVDLNWGIGYKGELLQRIPDDMKFFKQMTLGKIVIMGRETFESLPGKKPLKDRTNIVLTKNKGFNRDDVIICYSLEELFHILEAYPTKDVFVIGGESIYSQLLPYCTEVYVTKINQTYLADKHFMNLDQLKEWELVSISDSNTNNGVEFTFTKYINKQQQ